jgi:hypothetical protein
VPNLIPEKLKRQYEKCYSDFRDWCNKKNVKRCQKMLYWLINGKITNSEMFKFMEYVFNVEAQTELMGWH